MMQISNDLFFAQTELLLEEGSEVCIRTKGNSMRPFLRSDLDRVVLAPIVNPDNLQRGDIVLFRYKGRHVLHRIIRREEDRLTLSGDGNYDVFEHCMVADVRGIAVKVIRPSGKELTSASRCWRWHTRFWLAAPLWVRKTILRFLGHLQIR